MDILIHTCSGIAVGTVVSSFSDLEVKEKIKLIALSGFGGAIPDLDAISLWSGFDSTIGSFFNLATPGSDIYSAKYWYSHHAFLHSLAAGVLLAILLSVANWLLHVVTSANPSAYLKYLSRSRFVLVGFIGGFLIHLLEDMPTPSSTWGGVNFWWPSTTYIGGYGDIWWWNNYDIFLIVCCVIFSNLLLHTLKRYLSFDLRKLTVIIFFLGFSLATYQIKTRGFDFSYTNTCPDYQQYEAQSKEIQKKILGKQLFKIMERFDSSLKVYF